MLAATAGHSSNGQKSFSFCFDIAPEYLSVGRPNAAEMLSVFFHYADENFDGTVDTIVAPLTHPEYTLWVYNHGVLRSSKFDGNVDDDWTFRERLNEKAGHVPAREGRYVMQSPEKALSGSQWLEVGTKLLEYINSAATQCGFGPGSMPTMPD